MSSTFHIVADELKNEISYLATALLKEGYRPDEAIRKHCPAFVKAYDKSLITIMAENPKEARILEKARQKRSREQIPEDQRCCRSPCDIPVKPPASIKCKKCNKQWCCMECCIEDNALDHNHYDMIQDAEESPDQYEIVCCKCSGTRCSWEDREDE
jgi:hypothetical protein